tara:strand:+ start:241 stop:681 length:441 start_codon:yes stop_codon:yes gene_type:complete
MINEVKADFNKVIGAFTVYKFIKLLSSPFSQLDAFKYGIIDKNGKYLKDIDQLKGHELKSVNSFNRMIIGMKKIIDTHQNPSIRAKMKRLPTALMILQDEAEKIGADGVEVITEVRAYLKEIHGIEVDDDFEIDSLNEMFDEEIGE